MKNLIINNSIDANWSSPSPLVGSGFDGRSSDNALLAIMYGSLERASRFGWLNAGRTLVDKTYIHILWQAKQLPANGITHHDIAPLLELFVREQLQPIWPELNQLTQNDSTSAQNQQIAINLVSNAANNLFGSSYQEQAASWLLFYLCPQLPIFPVIGTLRETLAQQHNTQNTSQGCLKDSYSSYHQQCSILLQERRQQLVYPQPVAHYGTAKETAMIDRVIDHTDWWLRHCFISHMQGQ